jgi:ATP-dependent DNA ligase
MNVFSTYKSKIASRYIPVTPEQMGLKIPESEYYMVSIKFDGHLSFLQVTEGKAKLMDRNGDELKIPSIAKAAENLKQDCILVGELCCFEKDKSASHREVSAAIANPDKFDLRFGAFDILEIKGAAPNADVKERLEQLSKILGQEKEIFAIEQNAFQSRKDIINFFKTASDQNAEGIVVKVPGGAAYKVKQIHTLDLVILGYAESPGEDQGRLRELLLGFAMGDGKYQIVSKCGSGFNEKDRLELHSQLEKMAVQSEFTEVSGAKTAFIFVKPEMVVEISCLDLINENSEGSIRKARLLFDTEKGYAFEENENTISLISPIFIRVRQDKKADEKEAGTAQAYALTEPVQQTALAVDNKESEIVVREVFTKAGKGGTAIRKFLGLKTHKEASGLYAPFVVVFSDFSADRKTPLEQEIYLCKTEDEVKIKVKELKEENIKKGWETIK